MYIRSSYRFEREDGKKGLACGYKPEGVKILEEIKILYADEGFDLVDKNKKIINDSIILKEGDSQSNYTEIEKEPEEETEEK